MEEVKMINKVKKCNFSGSVFSYIILWSFSSTWNCVTGLTVLLWEDHFPFCPPCVSPSLSPSLFWTSPLPSFWIRSCTLGDLHFGAPDIISSWIPEAPERNSCIQTRSAAASQVHLVTPNTVAEEQTPAQKGMSVLYIELLTFITQAVEKATELNLVQSFF